MYNNICISTLVAADFVSELRKVAGTLIHCQDKEEKHIHVDRITVAESDQRITRRDIQSIFHGRIDVLILSKT
jgi:hypothetical protein